MAGDNAAGVSDFRRGRPLRALLFAPANHERHAFKALTSDADAAILDLEDSVAASAKPDARRAVAPLLRDREGQRPLAFVRINGMATEHAYPDLTAVVGAGLDGIVLPKTESAAQVATLGWLLDQLEVERGLERGRIKILPIVETAAGLVAATEIATASRRVWTINFGAADFALDTGMSRSLGNPGFTVAKTQLVLACRCAGVGPPIDTARLDLADGEALWAEAYEAFQLGFQGKACIHPKQLPVVLGAFRPDRAELARAREIVESFARTQRDGGGSLLVGPEFVDQPVVEAARRLLERYGSARGGPDAVSTADPADAEGADTALRHL
ncbi:MAG: HpcH/HpaI aldolase/citrate lyase family protein [Candidatus Dormibacteria bacterium]